MCGIVVLWETHLHRRCLLRQTLPVLSRIHLGEGNVQAVGSRSVGPRTSSLSPHAASRTGAFPLLTSFLKESFLDSFLLSPTRFNLYFLSALKVFSSEVPELEGV